MIKTIYVLRTLFPISCLHLYSHQTGSFLQPLSPGPSPHTEQHLKDLLQTLIQQTQFLNPSTPGDLNTPIYWRIIRYVPDYLLSQ
ncbi:hypothetical protein CHARACLAT_006940 [Characodon lateralis]|uniref:Secreted protein n=1 Tax=Characodon lateralis TaxID=208331 RepID=A0ABU7DEF1_9TELE|nr:hypothetical protein [Characodon lateralis]